MSQLYLLVNHIEIVVVYYDLYDIDEKFEYSCDVTNKAHLHPLMAYLLCLKGPTFSLLTFFLPKERVGQLRSESWRLTNEISVSGQKMGQDMLKEAQTKVLAYQCFEFGLTLNLFSRANNNDTNSRFCFHLTSFLCFKNH